MGRIQSVVHVRDDGNATIGLCPLALELNPVRELPPEDQLLLPRDKAPILYVPAQQWHCAVCDPDDSGPVSTTTVVWLGANADGPHGRCSSCGQKWMLSLPGESVPTVEEQLRVRRKVLDSETRPGGTS